MKRSKAALAVMMSGLSLCPLHAQPAPGYRGMSLTLDADKTLYLQPGDRVDVIVVFDGRGPGRLREKPVQEMTAGTMMKRMRVLAVKPSESAPGMTAVELQAGPSEAGPLEAAAHSGRLWLSLRKNGDDEDAPMEFAMWSKIVKSASLKTFRPRRPDAPAAAAPLRPDDAAGLAAARGQIKESRPALSLPLDADKAAFVRPGDRIDVLATFGADQPQDAAKRPLTATILQNVTVLDVRKSPARPGQSVLLLGLNFLEVQYAALAWETADVSILVREKSDQETHPLQPWSLKDW